MSSVVIVPPWVQASAPPLTSASIDVRTVAANDVAMCNHGPGTNFGVGWETMYPLESTDQQYGNAVRWPVAIPKDALIDSVTVTFYESQTNAPYNTADYVITNFEAVDNAAQHTTRTTYLSRYANLVAGATLYMGSSNVLRNSPLSWPLPTSMLQTLVNRSGWVSGNYVMFYMRTPGLDTTIAQWQAHFTRTTAYTPRLQVEYRY